MYLIDIVVLRCSTYCRRRERVTAKGGGDGKIKNLIVIIDFYFRINYSVNLVDGKMLRGRKQYSQDRTKHTSGFNRNQCSMIFRLVLQESENANACRRVVKRYYFPV